MLPKFLIADNSQEAIDLVYVVHTEKPRCIIQCDLDGFYSNQKIYWIDEEPLIQDDIDSLMEEAEDFYETELDNQEEIYDEEEDWWNPTQSIVYVMKYTKEDLKTFKRRDLKTEQIDRQLENFQKGFHFVELSEPAVTDNGILRINPEDEEILLKNYDTACQSRTMIKMVPASGSATRMFKDLFHFLDTYEDSEEEFLEFIQKKGPGTMHYFFEKLDELPFYNR